MSGPQLKSPSPGATAKGSELTNIDAGNYRAIPQGWKAKSAGKGASAENLQAACAYAQRGWHVLPIHHITESGACSCGKPDCDSPGKHPRTAHGQDDATTDTVQIERWWTLWPGANIGIHCKRSGLAVIDIDPRNGGDVTFARLEEEHGPVATGITSNTGGGGRHIIFAAPLDCQLPGKLGAGIELKYNGYIVAPPSNHKSGRTYQWADDPFGGLDQLPVWITNSARRNGSNVVAGAPSGETIDIAWADFKNAVLSIPNDDAAYDEWLSMGFSIHHQSEASDAGFELFDEWSQRSGKYAARKTLTTWNSMGGYRGQPRTGLSVLKQARELGWRPSDEIDDPDVVAAFARAQSAECTRLFDEWVRENEAAFKGEAGVQGVRTTTTDGDASGRMLTRGDSGADNPKLKLDFSGVESDPLLHERQIRVQDPRVGGRQEQRWNKEERPPKPSQFKTLESFCAEYVPLSYAVEPIIRTNSIYTLTAKTGTGKTGLLVAMALAVATGNSEMLGKEVAQGRVAYIACENPDDIRMRMKITADVYRIDLNEVGDRIVILDHKERPEDIVAGLAPLAQQEPFTLVLIDTLAAFFDGDDINDNVKIGEFIRRCRPLTQIAGLPALVVAAHPVKNAGEDALLPYGGGAIVNEVDGNLTLWKKPGETHVLLHWQGKLRGLEFQPVPFRFSEEESPSILDAKGRNVRLPVLRPSSQVEIEQSERRDEEKDVALLREMRRNPSGTQREWAEAIGVGLSSMQRALKRLEKAKLVEKELNRWLVAKKGSKFLDEQANVPL